MTTSTATNDDQVMDDRSRIFAIVAASSGNLVEWFDFYIYSFTSLYFAHAFFPSGNPTTQLLNTAGVFAAGFLCGPSAAGCSAASPTSAAASPRC
jgi:MHS family alpha-ketoglutarate permease-like MFS transporter